MPDLYATRLLNSAINTLEAAVVPALDRDDARIATDLVIRVLSMLSARFSTQEQGLEELLSRLQVLLDGLPGVAPAPGVATADAGLEQLQALRRNAESRLGAVIPDLVASAAKGDASAQSSLQQIVDDQIGYLLKLAPDIASGIEVVYRGGRIYRDDKPPAEAPQHVDDRSMSDYLRRRFPQRPGIVARDVKVVSGGFSKVTVLFTLVDGAGASERLVMRRDLLAPFMERSVLNEFPLLQYAHAAGVRVAEPCWAEADTGAFGGAFIVSKCVSGSSNMLEWRNQPGAAASVARDFAEVLAHLHAQPLDRMGFDAKVAAKSAGEAVSDEIAWWAARYESWRPGPNPLIDIPLAWMRQSIPCHLYDMPARMVHGDVGFHNLMVDAGRVTALLDWEFAHPGDPCEDLAFARLFMAQIQAWDDFIAHYHEVGGIAYSAECERFYQVWTSIRNTIGTIDAVSRFNAAPIDQVELKYAVAGILGPYLQVDSSRLVLDRLAEQGRR